MRKLTTTIIFAVLSTCCYSQDAAPKTTGQVVSDIPGSKTVEEDLRARKNNLVRESNDMQSLSKSLPDVDQRAAFSMDNHAAEGMAYLDAIYWLVGVYDRMQCDEDRNVAKAVLQNRLAFYSHMLDMSADQTNAYLGLTRVPAVAQQGQKIRDELRAAKDKLDQIAATLK